MAHEAGIWFPYHIKDIRSETYNMNRIEKCVYVDLLELLWENDGAISGEDKWISSALGMRLREWTNMRDRVLRNFLLSNGMLSHPRLTIELDKAKENIAQKRRAGIASAEARKAAKEAGESSTGVERALNGRTNGEATSGQPRAGGGGGGGVGSPHSKPREVISRSNVLGGIVPFPAGGDV